MKNFVLMSVLFLLPTTQIFADETLTEKAEVIAKDAKRAAQKAANRVTEKLCTGSEIECAAEKAKNRALELKDSSVDAFEKAKNIVD